MTASLDARINRLRLLRKANEDSKQISIRLPREASLNEQNAKWHPKGYYLFFCIHDKHLFAECKTCARSAAIAQANLAKFMKAQGL